MKLFYQQRSGFYFDYHTGALDFPAHIHNAVEVVFLLEGSSVAWRGKERVELSAGDVFVSFPNEVHSYEYSRDTRYYLLILPVKPCLASFAYAFAKRQPEQARLGKGTWEHTGLSELVERAYRDKETVLPEVMQAYMQVIFGKLLPLLTLRKVEEGKDEAVHAILEYLGEHYRRNLTRAELARAVGYHENYVSHIFSETLKTTLPQYLGALRVYDASAMLLETDLPIAQIAAELGFGSIRNFNRVFQLEMGMSPRAYRNAGGKQ